MSKTVAGIDKELVEAMYEAGFAVVPLEAPPAVGDASAIVKSIYNSIIELARVKGEDDGD